MLARTVGTTTGCRCSRRRRARALAELRSSEFEFRVVHSSWLADSRDCFCDLRLLFFPLRGILSLRSSKVSFLIGRRMMLRLVILHGNDFERKRMSDTRNRPSLCTAGAWQAITAIAPKLSTNNTKRYASVLRGICRPCALHRTRFLDVDSWGHRGWRRME
jgi:hypothetical protein